jgi:hypothetical protein
MFNSDGESVGALHDGTLSPLFQIYEFRVIEDEQGIF